MRRPIRKQTILRFIADETLPVLRSDCAAGGRYLPE